MTQQRKQREQARPTQETPARNDEGHVGTPSIPTPKALFTEHPRKLEEAHIMSIGEDPTHREVDALTPHSKPRAKRGTWDKGPPPAATDAQGKSGPIRQPPAVGERVVAVDTTATARPQQLRLRYSYDSQTSRYARDADHRPGCSRRTV